MKSIGAINHIGKRGASLHRGKARRNKLKQAINLLLNLSALAFLCVLGASVVNLLLIFILELPKNINALVILLSAFYAYYE